MWGHRKAVDALVFGLGNPGHRHARSRRNIGQTVVGAMIERSALPQETLGDGVDGAFVSSGSRVVCLAIPTTFVAHSASAMRSALDLVRARIVIVVYDLPDAEVGALKQSQTPGRSVPVMLARACPDSTVFLGVGTGYAGPGEDYAEWMLGDVGPDFGATALLAADTVEKIIVSHSMAVPA